MKGSNTNHYHKLDGVYRCTHEGQFYIPTINKSTDPWHDPNKYSNENIQNQVNRN